MAATRDELLDEVVAKIISGNRSTTAANLREVLNDFINAAYISESDGPITSPGDWYLAGNSTTDGSIRVHYNAISGEIEFQKRISGSWTNGPTFAF